MGFAIGALGTAVVWFLGSVIVAVYIDHEHAWQFKHDPRVRSYRSGPANWGSVWYTIALVLAWPVALPLALPYKWAQCAGVKLFNRVHKTEMTVEALDGKS